MTDVKVMEHTTALTPFGVRFWDKVTGSVITDGLNISAYALVEAVQQVQTIANRQVSSMLARRVQAFSNRQGVYLLRHLPGLRAAEYGSGDASYWTNVQTRTFVVEVVDTYRRFQSSSFQVKLPSPGLFTLNCPPPGSSLDTIPFAVPLYSASSRPVPGAMAALYADLWDLGANAPAAGAVLEARVPGQPPIRGFADMDGHVALIFPYPEPVNAALSSPNAPSGTTTIPLTQQEWPVQLQVAYTRLVPLPFIPDLCTIFQQPAATLWIDSTLTQPLTGAVLKFGQKLVVRSQDPSLPSRLLITPAGPPP